VVYSLLRRYHSSCGPQSLAPLSQFLWSTVSSAAITVLVVQSLAPLSQFLWSTVSCAVITVLVVHSLLRRYHSSCGPQSLASLSQFLWSTVSCAAIGYVRLS
jgi:hypothetical protein